MVTFERVGSWRKALLLMPLLAWPLLAPGCNGGGQGSATAASSKDAGFGDAFESREASSDRDALEDGDASDGDIYELPPTWSGSLPVVIGASSDAIALAIDDAHVYWQTPGGSVYGCPLTGCPSQKPTLLSSLIGSSSVDLESLSAENGAAIFLTAAGFTISNVAYSDPAHVSTTFAASNNGASSGFSALATDASHVYFTSLLETDGGFAASLSSCPLTGSCSSPKSLFAAAASFGNEEIFLGVVAVGDGEIYFAQAGDDNRIRAVSVDGGSVRTVCSASANTGSETEEPLVGIESMLFVGSYVYFTSSGTHDSIYECLAAGGGSPERYIRDYSPYALATDGTNLYWTNYVPVTGTVATCALGATCVSPFTVAPRQDAPLALAASATTVYWTTSSSVVEARR
jgi:hypothetical protein